MTSARQTDQLETFHYNNHDHEKKPNQRSTAQQAERCEKKKMQKKDIVGLVPLILQAVDEREG